MNRRHRFLAAVVVLLLAAAGCKPRSAPESATGGSGGLNGFPAAALAGPPKAAPAAAGLDGAWENVTPGFNPNLRQIKHINGNQFTWVIWDRTRRTAVLVSGGTCSLQGNVYKEVIEYCGAGIQEQLLGREQVLTVESNGDRVTFSGVLTSGVRINETYQRMR
ncbi:hypothetical protein R5W23_003688 [Gemmata sp. JC673]|uniref:Uncharacterized protein n=1 Tax=Gemmata algarum TaxID=2975278 RepID=A0ABU5F8P1_9BACT|nr:hypothetical protein [Gemmata algarum]MDY3562226.1 hypothetical protein [Gemmata algarum]